MRLRALAGRGGCLLGLGERSIRLHDERFELGLALLERPALAPELREGVLELGAGEVELGLGVLGGGRLGAEPLLQVGDLLLELLDPGSARGVGVVLGALQDGGPDRQTDHGRQKRAGEDDPACGTPARAHAAPRCPAKNSSAFRVFVSWSPPMSTPRSVRKARVSAAAWNASPGAHLVESSSTRESSG